MHGVEEPGAGGEQGRLIAEREAADRRYNEKLTAVDEAIGRAPSVPPKPSAYGDGELPALEARAAIMPSEMPEGAGGWRGWLRTFVWRLVAPMLERQQSFNATLVQHLKQDGAAGREMSSIVGSSVTVLRDELEALATFESQLAQYLQQITPFVDTRMRVLEHAMEELRMSAAAAQRASSAVKRELARLVGDGAQAAVPAASAGAPAVLAPVDSYKYVGFEDCFRGTPEAIGARLADYARYFEGASDVLDVGCGRGEFLDLLKARGVRARGIDVNPEMVEVCRARGLDVEQADALAYLRAQQDESLGGLLAAQVVEHMEPPYLIQFLEIAHHKLRPGALLVVETINPACWVAFFESYIRDITHVRPLHPDTMKYLVVASGFHEVNVQFRSPIAEAGKLERLSAPAAAGPGGVDAAGLRAITDLTRAFNANVDRLNERLFTYLDYAIIATR
jgi:2-polyprenyl-3-methyl-5-hydroxy-6-metoxy-1,4-benzoquinol methylase